MSPKLLGYGEGKPDCVYSGAPRSIELFTERRTVWTLESGLCLMPCLRELEGRGDVWLAAIACGCDGVGTKDILQLKRNGVLWIAAG